MGGADGLCRAGMEVWYDTTRDVQDALGHGICFLGGWSAREKLQVGHWYPNSRRGECSRETGIKREVRAKPH